MASALRRAGISYEVQWRIRRARPNARRSYYLDFALEHYIAIECDGQKYHGTTRQKTRDARRQAELEILGWHVLRFTGSDIVKDVNACVQVIQAALKGL